MEGESISLIYSALKSLNIGSSLKTSLEAETCQAGKAQLKSVTGMSSCFLIHSSVRK